MAGTSSRQTLARSWWMRTRIHSCNSNSKSISMLNRLRLDSLITTIHLYLSISISTRRTRPLRGLSYNQRATGMESAMSLLQMVAKLPSTSLVWTTTSIAVRRKTMMQRAVTRLQISLGIRILSSMWWLQDVAAAMMDASACSLASKWSDLSWLIESFDKLNNDWTKHIMGFWGFGVSGLLKFAILLNSCTEDLVNSIHRLDHSLVKGSTITEMSIRWLLKILGIKQDMLLFTMLW